MLTSRFGAHLRNSKWNQHVRPSQPRRALLPDEPYYGWLPSIWSITLHRWFGSLVMPVCIALVLVVFFLAVKPYYNQPWATVLCFMAHLGVLTFLSART